MIEMPVVVAAVLGVLLGAVVTLLWRGGEGRRAAHAPPPAPLVPAGVESVLTVLRSSAVLLDTDERVLKASAPAIAAGLVRDDRLVPDDLQAIARAVRRDGEVREASIEVPHARTGAVTHLTARVAPLGARLVLVLVEDRTRERRVEQLRRDFVANVSHELKTPVGALDLLAEAVVEAADDPDTVRRFAGRMRRESDRLARLVQQIIELSRLQADQLVDEPVEIDLADVVATALERSRTEAERRDIELRARCGDDLLVVGDPDQVVAAVSNLVENAVTYSEEGSRVAVTTDRVETSGRVFARVTVTDQGVGIPEAELDRIFERFYRVDPARHRSTGGTGLGLSIVKHVAASHGGDVTVWSQPGQGSSFTIRLPLHVSGDAVDSETFETSPLDVESTGDLVVPTSGPTSDPAHRVQVSPREEPS